MNTIFKTHFLNEKHLVTKLFMHIYWISLNQWIFSFQTKYKKKKLDEEQV